MLWYDYYDYSGRDHNRYDFNVMITMITKSRLLTWSSVVTVAWPEDPQSLLDPDTLAQATYHLPATIGTGSYIDRWLIRSMDRY